MITDSIKHINERSALIRLTALWAMNEAAVGGFLHLFRTPFSGLILASIAIVLISLIAYVATNPSKEILKALMIVLIIKLTLSPHSPITAYIAVSFQGLMGALLYAVFPFRFAAVCLGFLGLVESVLQKLLTLTLLFGMPLWESINVFIAHVLKRIGYETEAIHAQGSLWLVGGYISLYALTGLIVGWMIGGLPDRLNTAISGLQVPELSKGEKDLSSNRQKKPLWRSKKFRYMTGVVLLLTLIYFFVPGASELLRPLYLFLRVTVIILIWYLIVSPILLRLLQKFLNNKTSAYKEDVQQALALIPSFRQLVVKAWEQTSDLRGLKRIKSFLIIGLSYCLLYEEKQ